MIMMMPFAQTPDAELPTIVVAKLAAFLSVLHTRRLSPAVYAQTGHSSRHLLSLLSIHQANERPSILQH